MRAPTFLDVLGAQFIDALRAETAHYEMDDACGNDHRVKRDVGCVK
jgi:hypothetical protein